jgi:hypothetical protein
MLMPEKLYTAEAGFFEAQRLLRLLEQTLWQLETERPSRPNHVRIKKIRMWLRRAARLLRIFGDTTLEGRAIKPQRVATQSGFLGGLREIVARE